MAHGLPFNLCWCGGRYTAPVALIGPSTSRIAFRSRNLIQVRALSFAHVEFAPPSESRHYMLKRMIAGLLILVIIGLGGFFVAAYRPALPATTAIATFAPELIAKGEILAGAGNCAGCHTVKGSVPYSGGYAMKTAFGTIYSTNITPDPETGIGTWSQAAFQRALQEGVARDGSHLYPVFPYDHFTKISDEDVSALYAFMMTRDLARVPEKVNELPFPLNIRALQAGWKLLFFKSGRYAEQANHDAAWNRGAYLSQGLAHCGACHTPRNALGAEAHDLEFAGAPIDNWIAPSLTKTNPSPKPWTEAELLVYLRTAVSQYHGTAIGPMSVVVHDGLAKLTDADIKSIATYFADVNGAASHGKSAKPPLQNVVGVSAVGSNIYTAACASCHYNNSEPPNPLRPDLAMNSAVNLADPTNLIQVVLHGVSAKEGAPGVVMPAFANGLSDGDIAQLADYLRRSRTNLAPWPNLEKAIADIRAQEIQ
jgi:mono/diheme cytochrome c family protein